METDKLNKTNELLPYKGEPVPRLDTMGEGDWGRSGASGIGRIAWLIAGFNIGFLLLMGLALGVSSVVPSLHLQRAQPQPPTREVMIVANGDEQTAIALVLSATATLTSTSIPPTDMPSQTPSPTLEPNMKQTVFANTAATNNANITKQPPPSITPLPSPTLIPPTSTPLPPPNSYTLEGVRFIRQGWNDCGPANLAMGLSYYQWQGGQEETASWLKPNNEDKNVTPQQMVDYVNQFTNLRATWRMSGTLDQLKHLMANGFMVIIESGYEPPGEGWFGHYETVVGYDSGRKTITVYDSYLGRASRPQIVYGETQFDSQWQSFNRNYIVIYPPAREDELITILGADWNPQSNRTNAVRRAQEEAGAQPNNRFTWFNLGTSLTSIGRYEEAVVAFQRAFEIGVPYRMMWYQYGPYEAYLQTGRLDDVLTLANNTLRTTKYVEETFYYRGRVYETQGNYASAAAEYQNAVSFNPNNSQAQAALRRIESYQ